MASNSSPRSDVATPSRAAGTGAMPASSERRRTSRETSSADYNLKRMSRASVDAKTSRSGSRAGTPSKLSETSTHMDIDHLAPTPAPEPVKKKKKGLEGLGLFTPEAIPKVKLTSTVVDYSKPSGDALTGVKRRDRALSPQGQEEETLFKKIKTTPKNDDKEKQRERRVKTSPVKSHLPGTNETVARSFAKERDASGGALLSKVVLAPRELEDVGKIDNDDFCSACGLQGRFLCCESCPRSFHFNCLDPPVDENNLPEDDWYCNVCKSRKFGVQTQQRGLFQQMMTQMNRTNPVVFRLPKHIRDYFEGVTTGPAGEYQDTKDFKPIKINKSGFIEEADPYKLKDKHGKAILCYKCGKSALEGAIISCDHCPSHWHLDCLSPPLIGMPSHIKRWMCPNHALHAMKKQRVPKGRKVVDVQLSRGFKNNGDVEIANEQEKEAEDEFEEFTVQDVKYRLPERGIKLDFLDKVKGTWKEVRRTNGTGFRRPPSDISMPYMHVPPPMSETDEELLENRTVDEQEVVRNAVTLLSSMTTRNQKNTSLAALIDVAMADLHPLPTPPSQQARPGCSGLLSVSSPPAEAERVQLLAIQTLLRVKGKEALMKFLEA
ncbi:hypothetical protein SAICODRAFT_24800 [Saitoella complicata NRRL Y-17804]|nr:uncharacterized protein SAICODRAFT_24800 [Saitoella complicata NRRL Y-17804]ODQ53561.1 hypothetical protein SAICODRAFT_24800 [Saitoella complicata NRRL Y-17804]